MRCLIDGNLFPVNFDFKVCVAKMVLYMILFLPVLAREKSLAVDVLVLPLDVTKYNLHEDHAHAVMNHFQRVSKLNIV